MFCDHALSPVRLLRGAGQAVMGARRQSRRGVRERVLEVGLVQELRAWRHGRLAQRFGLADVTGKPILRHWL